MNQRIKLINKKYKTETGVVYGCGDGTTGTNESRIWAKIGVNAHIDAVGCGYCHSVFLDSFV